MTLSSGGQVCRPCPPNTGMIAKNGTCGCPDNYQLINNKCILNKVPMEGILVQLPNPNIAVKPNLVAQPIPLNSSFSNNIKADKQNYSFISSGSAQPSSNLINSQPTSSGSTNLFKITSNSVNTYCQV